MPKKKPLVVLNKLDQAPGESLDHYYRRLAKQADQRLVRLEAASHEEGYRHITNWAYATAKRDIEHWTGINYDEPGAPKPRFNTAPPANKTQLEAKIRDIRDFLEKPTSTKSGVTKFYKKRAESINRNQGTSFNWQQLADLFENDKIKDMMSDEQYGSGETLRVYSEIENGGVKILDENGEELTSEELINKAILKALEDDSLGIVLHVEDELIKDTIIEMLKNNDLDPSEILSRKG